MSPEPQTEKRMVDRASESHGFSACPSVRSLRAGFNPGLSADTGVVGAPGSFRKAKDQDQTHLLLLLKQIYIMDLLNFSRVLLVVRTTKSCECTQLRYEPISRTGISCRTRPPHLE